MAQRKGEPEIERIPFEDPVTERAALDVMFWEAIESGHEHYSPWALIGRDYLYLAVTGPEDPSKTVGPR